MTDDIPELVDKLKPEGTERPEETAAQYSEPVSGLDEFSNRFESAINSCTDSLAERLTTRYPSLSEPPNSNREVQSKIEGLHKKWNYQRRKTVKWRRSTLVFQVVSVVLGLVSVGLTIYLFTL